MKTILAISCILLVAVAIYAQSTKSFYDFKVNAIDGKPFDLASLKGKKVMVVNTASECGFTKQYADLQKLYEKYKDKNFVIIGFPANNFGGQEPGSNEEISQFCKKNYGVSFPMMEKISVKGDDTHPLYKWLTSKAENGSLDGTVKWNFHKFLINEKGQVVQSLGSAENPMSDNIISWIEGK